MHMVNHKYTFFRNRVFFLTVSHFLGSVLLSLNFGRMTSVRQCRLLGKCKISSENSKHIFPFSTVTALNIKSIYSHE